MSLDSETRPRTLSEATSSQTVTSHGGRRIRRTRVAGGGCLAFGVRAGDRLTIIDPEGAQLGLLYALSETEGGQAVIPSLSHLDAPTLEEALDEALEGRAATEHALGSRNIALGEIRGSRLFGPDSAPGSTAKFEIKAHGLCVLAAPGRPMAPDEQDTPTDLLIEIEQVNDERLDAPPPLAEPKLDLRRIIVPSHAISSASTTVFCVKITSALKFVRASSALEGTRRLACDFPRCKGFPAEMLQRVSGKYSGGI